MVLQVGLQAFRIRSGIGRLVLHQFRRQGIESGDHSALRSLLIGSVVATALSSHEGEHREKQEYHSGVKSAPAPTVASMSRACWLSNAVNPQRPLECPHRGSLSIEVSTTPFYSILRASYRCSPLDDGGPDRFMANDI